MHETCYQNFQKLLMFLKKVNCKLNFLGDLNPLKDVVILNDLGGCILHDSKQAFHGHIF